MDIAHGVFSLMLLLLGGVYALWIGWTRTRAPERAILTPVEAVSVALAAVFGGRQRADAIRRHIMEPDQLRRSGQVHLNAAGIALFGAGLQFCFVFVVLIGQAAAQSSASLSHLRPRSAL
jgi:hypothetical protein